MLAYIHETDAVANAARLNGHSKSAIAAAASINKYADEQIHPNSNTYHYAGLDAIDKVYGDQ